MPIAAVVIIRNSDGKILSATRKDDVIKYCFPGGKLDLGEDPAQAAARELMEETGIRLIDSHDLGSLSVNPKGFSWSKDYDSCSALTPVDVLGHQLERSGRLLNEDIIMG